MDDFESMAKQVAKIQRPEPNVKGSYDCQWCYEPVDEAHYDPVKKVLIWRCSEDHVSVIEEYSFG